MGDPVYVPRCPACLARFVGMTVAEARDHLDDECPAINSDEYCIPRTYVLCDCGRLIGADCHRCPFCTAPVSPQSH